MASVFSRELRWLCVPLGLLVFAACGDDGAGGEPAANGGKAAAGSAGRSGAGAAGAGRGGSSGSSNDAGNAALAGASGAGAASGQAGSSPAAGGEAGAQGEAGESGASGSAAGGASGSAGEGGNGGAPDAVAPGDVFRASTRFTLINPKDYGAEGDGSNDDAEALQAAFDAVPEGGGIVLFPAGTYLKHQRQVRVNQSHTLLWSPNRRATLHGTVRSLTQEERDDGLCGARQQAVSFRQTTGGGVYGLRFTSDASERTSCAEDCQITLDTALGMEVVGTEIDGAAACGVFAWSSRADGRSEELYVEGNFIHHTYADSVHHTHGARRSWCWENYFFNEAPSLGDDGIACVTYSPSDPRCGEMEWWNNTYLGGMHGRGLAVIGGEDISIHHNWVIGSASAGLIVASEWAYTSASSERIELRSNWIIDSPNGSVDNGHSSILISGGNTEAEPLRDIQALDNVVIGAPSGRVERAEGEYDAESIVFDNSTDAADLPGAIPTLDDVVIRDTSILRTRDLSFVEAAVRRGLYRIHVREAAAGGIEERFEYVVSGSAASVSSFLEAVRASGGYVSEARDVGSVRYAHVLVPAPLEVPAELDAVTFEALRAGDRDGALSWLWARLELGE
jgi:hypothetical protein